MSVSPKMFSRMNCSDLDMQQRVQAGCLQGTQPFKAYMPVPCRSCIKR